MKKFLLLVLLLLAAVLIPMAFINYYVDPAGTYHAEQTANKIIEGFEKGYNVVIRDANIDDRIYKKELVEHLYINKNVDYVILGPSRVFMIDTTTLHTNSILNLGVAAAQINDYLALYQICKDNQLKIKNIIIGCDATMFNITDTRWKSIEEEYLDYMGEKERRPMFREDKLQNLISVSYFQSAVKSLKNGFFSKSSNITYSNEYENKYATKHADGSSSYASDYRNRDINEVDREAGTWMNSTFSNTENIDLTCLKVFKQLVKTLNSNGINVYFFFCPYHPVFYERIKGLNAIVEGKNLLTDIAHDNKIAIIGSYNPLDVNCSNKDFYDAAHLRKEAVDRIFDDFFKNKLK